MTNKVISGKSENYTYLHVLTLHTGRKSVRPDCVPVLDKLLAYFTLNKVVSGFMSSTLLIPKQDQFMVQIHNQFNENIARKLENKNMVV